MESELKFTLFWQCRGANPNGSKEESKKKLESFRKAFDVTKVFAIKKKKPMVVLKGYIFNIQKI